MSPEAPALPEAPAEEAPEQVGGEPARAVPEPGPDAVDVTGASAEDRAEPGAAEESAPEGESGAAEGDGSRFTVRLVNFEGPFDLLLQLISKHKLDVTEVALSEVTDEFMAYIRAMGPDWDLDQTTEFLVVAATLLDLKAARLLPAAEVEDEADLALLEARDLLFARLLQYRAYKRIAEIFQDRLESEARRHPRTVGLEDQHAALLPDVVISIGPDGFAKLASRPCGPGRNRRSTWTTSTPRWSASGAGGPGGGAAARGRDGGELRGADEDAADTLTVVARFLALLELYREKAVTLDQDEALGELLVAWCGGEGAEPVVTDEFDQEPGGGPDEEGVRDE